jgi:hypothetical protein
MSPREPGYRYEVTARLTVDDTGRLGPEALEAAIRAVLRLLPARVVGDRVAVELEEIAPLDPDDGAGGGGA